jgi:hypothetical protein
VLLPRAVPTITQHALARLIPSQPGHPVEVRIVTCETVETIGLHDCDNQGVAYEQLNLLAREGRGFQKLLRDQNDPVFQLGNRGDSVLKDAH